MTVPVGNRGTVTFQVTGGTWTGTIQPQGVIDGNAAFNIQVIPFQSTTAQNTITANGIYTLTVAGLDLFKLCGATVTNTATVKGNAVQVVSKNSPGGGGGGGSFSALTSGTNTTAAMVVGSGASLSTSGSGIITASNGIGLNNIQSYASGIAISDGSAHIVSAAPAGSAFNGITTLAGLAAVSINGATPFSWVNAAPFTGAGAYNLVDADVPNLDIAWLAIQAGLVTGKAYVPGGTYIIGSVKALPLYRPLTSEAGGSTTGATFEGDGPGVTFIRPGFDWGSGKGTVYCGDPQGTSGNSLGRYANTAECSGLIRDMTIQSSAGNPLFSIGATTIAMDGLMWGARWMLDNVTVAGFNHNFSLVGDHTRLSRLHSFGGTTGIYWDAPSASLLGDVTFDDLRAEGASQAAIAVNSAATIAGAVFNGETYLSAPTGFLFEAGSCTAAMSGVDIDHLFDEFMGNALISDESGLSGGVWTEANKCRNIIRLHVNSWFQNWSNSKLWTTGGRGRRATVDSAQLYMQIDMMSGSGAQIAPISPSSGPAPLATFNVKSFCVSGFACSIFAGDVNGWYGQNTGTGLGIPTMLPASGGNALLNDSGLWYGPEVDLGQITVGSGILGLNGITSGKATLTASATASSITSSVLFLVPDGSAGVPGIAFTGGTNAGLRRNGTGEVITVTNGSDAWRCTLSTTIFCGVPSTGLLFWTSGAITASADTGLSRDSAGVVDVGTGAQGNKLGTINLLNLNATGLVSVAGTTSGFVALGQGSDNSNQTTSALFEAPASVTSYRMQVPGANPTNNNSAMLFSNATPSVGSFAKMPQTAITSGSAYTNATTTFSNLTGSSGQSLAFAVEASTNYLMICNFTYRGSATTAGLKVQVTGPASPTSVALNFTQTVTTSATLAATFSSESATAFSSAMGDTVAITATTDMPATMTMGLVNGANAGTVQVQAAADGTGTVTVQPGAFCTLQ